MTSFSLYTSDSNQRKEERIYRQFCAKADVYTESTRKVHTHFRKRKLTWWFSTDGVNVTWRTLKDVRYHRKPIILLAHRERIENARAAILMTKVVINVWKLTAPLAKVKANLLQSPDAPVSLVLKYLCKLSFPEMCMHFFFTLWIYIYIHMVLAQK